MGSGGTEYDSQDRVAKNRANYKSWFLGTGAQIVAFVDKLKGTHAHCTSSGSGRNINHDYVWDGAEWRDLTAILPFRRHLSLPPSLDLFAEIANGTATVVQGSGSIAIDTGTTSDSEAGLTLNGVQSGLNRARPFELAFYLSYVTTALTLELRATDASSGIPTAATDNCAAFIFDPAVSANWRCVTSAGTTLNTTTTSVVANGALAYFVIIATSNEVRFYINGALVATHTTHLPTSGVALDYQLFVENTAAANKSINYYGGEIMHDVV